MTSQNPLLQELAARAKAAGRMTRPIPGMLGRANDEFVGLEVELTGWLRRVEINPSIGRCRARDFEKRYAEVYARALRRVATALGAGEAGRADEQGSDAERVHPDRWASATDTPEPPSMFDFPDPSAMLADLRFTPTPPVDDLFLQVRESLDSAAQPAGNPVPWSPPVVTGASAGPITLNVDELGYPSSLLIAGSLGDLTAVEIANAIVEAQRTTLQNARSKGDRR